MELKRLNEAESVLRECLASHGEDGVVMTNLAKVYSSGGDHAKADTTLWRALELDPNQENGLAWYVALAHERGGDAASLAAYQRVAALPGSWRAQIWLARRALERGAVAEALGLYSESLSRVERPSAEMLMQISGDLGNNGRLRELVDIVAPRFQSDPHGLLVGNNLLKAYIELGMFDEARRLLAELYALKRPDYRETLAYWENELDSRTRGLGPVHDGQKPTISLFPYVGVVWAREMEGLLSRLPEKMDSSPAVTVMAATCSLANPSEVAVVQRTNIEGGLSRAITLALAEAVYLDTSARGVALIPVAQDGRGGGFVLANHPWDDAEVLEFVRGNESSTGLAVNLHVDASHSPWTATMSVIRAADGALLERLSVQVDPAALQKAVIALSAALVRHALSLATVQRRARPAWAAALPDAEFSSWMAASEQVLAIQFASLEKGPRLGLYAPRSIIDGLFASCLNAPTSARWRMLLVTALNRLRVIEPAMVAEYRERLMRLQERYPLGDDVGVAVSELVGRLVQEG